MMTRAPDVARLLHRRVGRNFETEKGNIMPLYNVDVTLDFVMVVQADDEIEALSTACGEWKDAMDDGDNAPDITITGEVTSEEHLRVGWDGMRLPYGGDGNKRLRDLLTPDA